MGHPTDIDCSVCKAPAGAVCTLHGIRRQQGPHKTRVKEYHELQRSITRGRVSGDGPNLSQIPRK